MKLSKISNHIWITDFEERRDRPSLGFIHTPTKTIAVDAGHSKEHVEEFYELLKTEQLPLPDLTILTHWHWDHTFGLHAIHGLSIAEQKTQNHLQEIISTWNDDSEKEYKEMDAHIYEEYAHQPMVVKGADLVFENHLTLYTDELTVEVFHVDSSHTDDSSLVLVPEEKVLFFGDSICGCYPDWIVDYTQRNLLIETLKTLDFDIAVGGHWKPFTKHELIDALVNDQI